MLSDEILQLKWKSNQEIDSFLEYHKKMYEVFYRAVKSCQTVNPIILKHIDKSAQDRWFNMCVSNTLFRDGI